MCALHAAHQSHVEAWIIAASDKLHEAVTEHLAAIAASTSQSASGDAPVAVSTPVTPARRLRAHR